MHSKSVLAMIAANTKHSPISQMVVHGAACVEWQGARNDKGYGQRSIRGKRYYIHVLVWEEVNGPVPKGKCVLHHCDNPPCYNYDHLFLGTKADNTADMYRKGRARPPAKLKAVDIPIIRQRAAAGEELIKIAVDYGVTASNISAIKCGRSWTWIF